MHKVYQTLQLLNIFISKISDFKFSDDSHDSDTAGTNQGQNSNS